MSSFIDTIFIIIFIIVVLIIISLSVTKLIDKKITGTKIVVNVCKNSKGDIEVAKNSDDKVEKFIVADANDFQNYRAHRERVMQKSDVFEDEIDNSINKESCNKDDDFYTGITYDFRPIEAQKRLDEHQHREYVSASDFGWESPRQYAACANSSISQKFKSGPKSLMPFQISCTRPNKITAENYYKTHYSVPVIPIEDHYVRGHNYMDYSNWVEPTKIDQRILSQSTKGLPRDQRIAFIPTGWNYGFHNTPAMTMP